MQTSDWAAEAYTWFESYHEAVLSGKDLSQFFGALVVDNEIVRMVTDHPLLRHVRLENWQSSPFDALEMERGWQPLLRRLPSVPDNRLLTLARRNLLLPLRHRSNQTLISRQHWALLEGLRCKAGLYKRPEVLNAIGSLEVSHEHSVETDSHSERPTPAVRNGLQVEMGSAETGRYVTWQGSGSLEPGDVIWEGHPFVVAPYELEHDSTAKSSFCFHCCRPITFNPVRELTLLCKKCNVWSYCDAACKRQNAYLHEKECSHVAQLLDRCRELDMPLFKSLLVHRAALKTDTDNWRELLKLECHREAHHRKNPDYAHKARSLSKWMLQNGLIVGDVVDEDTLCDIFFIININAIGLRLDAAGLFPGIPSMFNHSCNENVTHSWDRDGKLRFRANRTIHPGEECSISYVSQLEQPTAQRTSSLEQFKFFTCHCSRCLSPDEEGRSAAVQEWGDSIDHLKVAEGDSMQIYRRLVDLSEVLFPKYFVAKGWALEECAHALLQDNRLRQESVELLHAARQQYVICRGEESELVSRVDQALQEITSANQETPDGEADTMNENDDSDLVVFSGWGRVLYEIKPYDSETPLQELAKKVKSAFDEASFVRWSEGYRLYEIGYGIKTLILACDVDESKKGKEDLALDIVEDFEDDIQNVDIVTVTDYR